MSIFRKWKNLWWEYHFPSHTVFGEPLESGYWKFRWQRLFNVCCAIFGIITYITLLYLKTK